MSTTPEAMAIKALMQEALSEVARPMLARQAELVAKLNATTSAMGALTMCMTKQLTTYQREMLGRDVALLATHAERSGDTELESLLIDMHRAIG